MNGFSDPGTTALMDPEASDVLGGAGGRSNRSFRTKSELFEKRALNYVFSRGVDFFTKDSSARIYPPPLLSSSYFPKTAKNCCCSFQPSHVACTSQ